jgi:thermitase
MKSRNLKILAITTLMGALLGIGAHVLGEYIITEEESQSVRFASLGIPQVVNLDKTLGEPKVIMNDPSIQKNWGLMGTKGHSDIRVNSAWSITQGNRQIVVAVIDTGIDVKHPDLAENLWRNPGESGTDSEGRNKATNGLDDDKNGYIDDLNGWDFVNDKPFVIDNHGHGTHIAGIVGAVGGNGVGISGVCPKVSLMALKYFDPTSKGNDNLRNTVRAIRYASLMGAHIINYSGGGTEANDDEFEAIRFAQGKGVLFVAAAGNERSNSDISRYYPADYNLSNIISVTAIDSFAKVLRSSNYGMKTVHIAAPGEGIYSTLPGGNYGLMTGTSQATAFVTGVAALILSHNKEFNFEQVRKQIIATADEIPGLRDKTSSSGKLNSYAALAIQPSIPATGISIAASPNNSPSNLAIVGTDATRVIPTEQSIDKAAITSIIRAINRPLAGTTTDSIEKRSAAQAL